MVKNKTRFDGLDISAMVAHWNRTALGRRVINIYNGPNGETYVFKLDKQPGETANMVLVVESGIRFHATRTPYENPGAPSQFCAKLRKHLRGLRLEQVQQLGLKDRVVNFVFGSGAAQRHSLIVEFYARGNVILTNSEYSILSLLRSHEYSNNNETADSNVKVKVGHVYPVTYATTTSKAIEGDVDGDGEDGSHQNAILLTAQDPIEWYEAHKPAEDESSSAPENNSKKSKKNKKGGGGGGTYVWKQLLSKQESGVSHYGPSLLDHCILCASLEKRQLKELDANEWKQFQTVLKEQGDKILNALDLVDSKGYIIYQPKEQLSSNGNQNQNGENTHTTTSGDDPASDFADKILVEFQPHLLKQHESLQYLEYDTFENAVDLFFSRLENQKRIQRVEAQQQQAQQKLEKIKKDQEQRVASLMQQQEVMKEQAQLVELHADMVEKAIQVVNSALDSGMDWDQLEELVDVEKNQNHNPVAMLIHKLDLENDNIVLQLKKEEYMYEEPDDEDDGADESEKHLNITISLQDSAHGNASALFAKYRASKDKSQKTIEASTKALQAAEETAQKQLEDALKRKSHLTIETKRKPLWFEKFNWFVTSDNYLCIAGRDAQQNEQLVKKYLRPGDAYLHADVHGAASCILRAKRSRKEDDGKTSPLPLSDQALREAGNFTICKSSAWSSRMVTSAWWVESHQVSKTAPTGEYLTVGSFMIRGKKNFLPPTQLEMGLGVMFCLGDDESIARHRNERRDFALMDLEQTEALPDTGEPSPSVPHTSRKLDRKADPDPSSKPETVGEQEDSETPKVEVTVEELPRGETPASQESIRQQGQEDPITEQKGSPKKKKGLSVKERKLIRKYGSLEAAEAAASEREATEIPTKKSNLPASDKSTASGFSSMNTMKRGKKAKMKKMMKKYADQDDEDRELALLALHAGEKDKGRDKKKAPTINESEKEAAAETVAILKKDAAEVAATLPPSIRNVLAECVTVRAGDDNDTREDQIRWNKFDADVLEQLFTLETEEEKLAAAKRLLNLKLTTRVDNFSASLAGIIRTIRKYGHQNLETDTNVSEDTKRKTKAEKEAENAAWKQALADEGIVDEEVEDDTIDDTVELSKLTGKPQVDDLILFAVPVCAPYQTLSKYNFRVKLTPGNMKRGKASKQCVEMFVRDTSQAEGSERNKEFIKKVSDTEWVQAVQGDVKISAPGASKMTKNQKSKAKKKKK